MIIKKLILHKYKRFFLTGIETLTYEPEKTMQIIVSKNGAGKSSLLQELNPLPADIKKNYYEGGYKYIEILHYGKLYTLCSGKTSPNRHSMILDGIELNPGGTRKVQLELVKEHFNLNPNIIDILLNYNKLTTMPVSERKKWLSQISTIDYEYPISIYNTLKSKHRDMIGGIKLLENEIITLSNNKLNKEQLNILKENRNHLAEFHNHLISLYNHTTESSNPNYLSNLEYNIKKIEQYLQDLNHNIRDLNVITNEISETTKKRDIIDSEIKTTNKVIDDIEKITSIKNPELILQTINKLDIEIGDILKYLPFEAPIEQLESWYKIYQSALLDIKPLVNSLSDYDKYRLMSKEDQSELITKFNNLEVKVTANRNSIQRLQEQYEKLKQGKDIALSIVCPTCSNNFNYNIVEHKKQHVLSELVILDKEQQAILKDYDSLSNDKKLILEKDKILQGIREVIGNTLIIKPIWKYIFSIIDLNKSSTEYMIRELDKLLLGLESWSKATTIHKEMNALKEQYKIYKDVSVKNESVKKDSLEVYIKKLDELTKEKNILNNNLTTLQFEYSKCEKLKNEIHELYSNLTKLKYHNKSELKNLRNYHLSKLTEEYKTELLSLDKNIREQDNLISNIQTRQVKLEEYKKDEKILHAMVRALSPTEGLIAKSINSFLQVFVKEMNAIINKVWSYDLELLPCEIGETNDLDYKFRVKVNNDEIIEDVSRLSTGMKEIVDLAFRIIFAKYSGLHEVPLYLDEFGHGFDKNHRTIAYNVIDKILSSDYPQVFIVCHYESLYGSFKNVDFNVLDGNPDNAGNSTFNNRLKLKY